MIIPVNEQNIMDAAIIHSISWRESHRDFCTPEFIEIHSPERQLRYMLNAERLYCRMGFTKTGRINAITDKLAEIELVLEYK